jgi:hypothetical protein
MDIFLNGSFEANATGSTLKPKLFFVTKIIKINPVDVI